MRLLAACLILTLATPAFAQDENPPGLREQFHMLDEYDAYRQGRDEQRQADRYDRFGLRSESSTGCR